MRDSSPPATAAQHRLTFEERRKLKQARSDILRASIDYREVERAEAELRRINVAAGELVACPVCGQEFKFVPAKGSYRAKTYCTKQCANKALEVGGDVKRKAKRWVPQERLLACPECGVERVVRQNLSEAELAARRCFACAMRSRRGTKYNRRAA